LHRWLRKHLVAFFNLQFCDAEDEYDESSFMFITGCRSKKYSMHIVAADCLLDRGYISCKYLAWEFSRYLSVKAWEEFIPALRERVAGPPGLKLRMLTRALMLHKQFSADGAWMTVNNTMCDEVIYNKNRLMRTVGGCKPNTCHLRILTADEDHIGPALAVGE
jgi:hypothetical protein